MRKTILSLALAVATAPFTFAQGSSTTGSSLSPNVEQGAPKANDATATQTTGKKAKKKNKKNKNQNAVPANGPDSTGGNGTRK